MRKMLVWEVLVAKEGKKKPFKKLHILAEFFLQAAHMAANEVYGEDEDSGMFDFDVNIIGINKMREIKDLVNAHSMDDEDEMMGYDPDQPYDVAERENYPQERVIKFKCCNCKNEQKVANYGWHFIVCRDCKTQILHKNLENVGGIWVCHSEK